jgi:hypothetical protein
MTAVSEFQINSVQIFMTGQIGFFSWRTPLIYQIEVHRVPKSNYQIAFEPPCI